ncbi:hypothetical protein H696_04912 [Fonticula alba]|uniref:COMM domain-containing protein 5 n=1 Tax=Fonticula alba TaxID=691883 RepID=A0A058Z3X2_FONAL|nr:hypothetical protein H696_04912 [Fonticula alba]KCV68618.1 hypothetical protein H696_04912 [Fonticula alba]|eukprot:XP_009497050.1 hypothetical protein H696_04912 [Fonticula alba]
MDRAVLFPGPRPPTEIVLAAPALRKLQADQSKWLVDLVASYLTESVTKTQLLAQLAASPFEGALTQQQLLGLFAATRAILLAASRRLGDNVPPAIILSEWCIDPPGVKPASGAILGVGVGGDVRIGRPFAEAVLVALPRVRAHAQSAATLHAVGPRLQGATPGTGSHAPLSPPEHLPRLRSLKWRTDIAISTGTLSRAMHPTLLLRFTLSDGRIIQAAMPVGGIGPEANAVWNRLRQSVAMAVYRTSCVRDHPVLAIRD